MIDAAIEKDFDDRIKAAFGPPAKPSPETFADRALAAHTDALASELVAELPEPVEPAALAGERTLLRHTETGLTVSEDLDSGGVWIRQETPGTVDEVYVTRGAWMCLVEWLKALIDSF